MARIIKFEGRTISVPDDATDDEVRQIIDGTPSPAAVAAPAAPAPAVPPAPANGPIVPSSNEIMSGEPAAPAVAPAAGDGRNYGTDTMSMILEGLREGAGQLLGAPVDIVNASPVIAGALTGSWGLRPITDKPVGGSQFFDELLSGYGAVPAAPEPKDFLQSILKRTAQELGGSFVPMAGTLGAVGRLTAEEARALPGLAKFFEADKAAIAPAKFVGDNVAMSIGAGTGAGIANEGTRLAGVDPNSPTGQIADLVGAITGSGITGLGSGLIKGAGNVVAGMTGNPKFAGNVVKDNVVDTIIQNSDTMGRQVDPTNLKAPLNTDELVSAITRKAEAETMIPGYKASTADRAGDAGLGLLEAARAKAAPGVYRARNDTNTQAVEGAVNDLRPTEQPGAFSEQAIIERQARIAADTGAASNAKKAFDDAIATLQPSSPNETARGSDIRAALEDAQTKATEFERGVWEAASTNDPVEYGPLADAFKSVDDSLTDVERAKYRPAEADIPAARIKKEQGAAEGDAVRDGLDPEDQKVFDALMGAPDEAGPVSVSAREVTSLRSALTTDIRKATSGLEPDENKARVLKKYVDAIDGYMEDTPELAGRFDTARAVSKDINDRFNRAQTGIAQTLAKNGGMPQVDASAVPGKFVQPDSGRVTDYRALMQEAGRDPRARRAVSDQVIADARSTGVFDDPTRLKQFMDERSIVLSDFPELRAQMERAGRARGAATAAADKRDQTVDTLTKPGKSAVADYLSFGPEKAESAMSRVLSGKQPGAATDELLTFVSDKPDAVEGLRAAFWKQIDSQGRAKNAAAETDSGVMPLVPRKVAAFLDKPEVQAVAQRLYRDNPEHLANIKKMFAVLRTMNTGSRIGNAVNPSGSGLMKGNPPVTMAEIGSKAYQANIGKGSIFYAATYLAGKVLRNVVGNQRSAAYEMLLDKALLDPDLAAALLKENNPANRAAVARKAKQYLGNQASTLINAISGQEESDVEKATK